MTESQWTNDHRKYTWFIMVRMRLGFHANVNPTVGTAYVILQKYFSVKPNTEYKLYILIITAYLITFKNEDLKSDIRILFEQFLNCCRDYQTLCSPEKLVSIFGCNSIEPHPISSFEEKLVSECELEILEALDYEPHVELVYSYCDDHFLKYSPAIAPQVIGEIEKDFGAFFSAEEYTSLSLESVAAVIMHKHLCNREAPQETKEWIKNVLKKIGKEGCSQIASLYKRQTALLSLQHQ
ncbi:Cyclin, N-terminal domain containing protein [Tritrichomonas foetus]|uniref:Cyclin, N-terminal domain containing protein n=1 Tax=Tritrichomonas foetus TaxID=1144522 RepID=A0A1J4L1W8_9EUKA|nr:Cyclin, N-terminal domain containing protein [Tritrichomonas foetus]|eukprot:OHT15942.1 Cyclin, N-terminal domain containing protein [Tritrichomonas foetus]